MNIRVAVLDDEYIIAADLARQLSRRSGWEVVGVFLDPSELQRSVEESPVEVCFLGSLETRHPDSANRIKALMFVFEDLGRLDAGGVQTLLRAADKADLALALKGSSETLRSLFFANMSERGGKLLRDDMLAMGPVRLKDVDAAQTRLVALAKDLSAKGELVLSDGKSEDELIY